MCDAVAHPPHLAPDVPEQRLTVSGAEPDSASIPAESRMQIASIVFWSDRSPEP